MIKYNFDKIMRATKGESTKIMTVVELLTYQRIPFSTKDKTYNYYGTDFSGHSFLVNPEELLIETRNYSMKEAAEYLAVASYRNYYYYEKTKDTTLEILHLPVSLDIINNNRLLRIKDEVVHFKFEDNAKENNNGNKI